MLNIKFCCYSQHANVVGTLSGHASWVLSVAFSPNGKQFVSGSSDRTVKIWELATKQCIHTFSEHSDQVSIDFGICNIKLIVKLYFVGVGC